ncbi:uncharacterized protein J4E87_010762 [Alternaria ethzedia]|uniref:uncharacterized protein n=1 Tax=Alternaria ethzedia TaxID=181014 RepID=UPI0020C4F001|nr:uncharacterized protein J4E87_010762 [Alternaria ethzedia]KAI4610586.1 hypothetical protein J4E87_010762 [Alternaria ethzedia]
MPSTLVWVLIAVFVWLFVPNPFGSKETSTTSTSESEMPSNCARCNKAEADTEKGTLQRCAKCKTTPYCSRDCQKDDWKNHKKICAQQAQANANAYDGFPPKTEHSSNYAAPRMKTLEKHVPNPFTRLDDGKYLHDRPEKDVYRLLIDSFRMRSEDDNKLENKPTPNSIYTGKSSSIEPFKKFLDLAETRRGLLPPWWNAEHRQECEKWAESGEWNDVRKKVTKAEMISHYGDDKAPMQLRMVAEFVYGSGSKGESGTAMRKVLRGMEGGGLGLGNFLPMSLTKVMGGGS